MADSQPIQHRALCPTCGRLAVRETITSTTPVVRAVYQCERGHGWGEHWPAPAAA